MKLLCCKVCHSYGVQKLIVDCTFYQHAMPNGILKTNNAVRQGMLVAYN